MHTMKCASGGPRRESSGTEGDVMKILYATTEASPFVNNDDLTAATGALPGALCALGADARVVLPLYAAAAREYRDKMKFLLYGYVEHARRKHYCGLLQLELDGVQYYFIENEPYFQRERAYDPDEEAERVALFSQAVIRLLPMMDWKPDIMHCIDWQTALLPICLRQETAPMYRDIRTVFTIRDAAQQGRFRPETAAEVFAAQQILPDSELLHQDGEINLMKGAIQKADLITTVSPSYACELREAPSAFGLHRVMENNSHKLRGILGGIDNASFDPATDQLTYCAYDRDDLSGKAVNKSELQRNLGLDMESGKPVIACISKLVHDKGLDMVRQAVDFIVGHDAQLVILGTGDTELEQAFVDAQAKYPGSVSANIMTSDTLARRIYAGADIFLMPSRTEPCGQAQMIAMRYGTVPLVRQTGGLKDSVIPYPAPGSNGFAFAYAAAEDMLETLRRALDMWNTDRAGWNALVRRCMDADFAWSAAAREYLRLYEQLVGRR